MRFIDSIKSGRKHLVPYQATRPEAVNKRHVRDDSEDRESQTVAPGMILAALIGALLGVGIMIVLDKLSELYKYKRLNRNAT